MTAPGRFISFEGIDGSGKSTQARRLHARLSRAGGDTVLTREPGGSDGAEAIRSLLVSGATDRWSPETEILLFTAARRDHLERTIEPALARGADVICDRFADSTRVYQGIARADLGPLVDRLHDLVIGREPDLTLIVDLDPEEALDRGLARQSGEDRFEEFGLEFQRRLREGYAALATRFPDRCVIVDGSGTEDAVAGRVAAVVTRRWPDG